ncbi:unnamed protein product [Caenorhabditis sp. 36 PRJEB53466]|nr:unnamed protein product [Caenorhabditis sp. 36 PRJEB53466]
MLIECDGRWISAVVIAESFAASALHCVPDSFRVNGTPMVFHDEQGELHSVHVHGSSTISDYIVYKKDDGLFKSVPELTSPQLIDKYLVMGCAFGEKTMSVRCGRISSVSTGYRGFFYGDSGGLPGFSGGGVFCARNGFLMGITRGSDYDGQETKQYGDVLEMISAPLILSHIEFAKHEPFSV